VVEGRRVKGHYVVVRETPRAGPFGAVVVEYAFLHVNGPFAYPEWGAAERASVFTYVQANAYGNAYGGDVKLVQEAK
jgi:hypothetical protein